jgi:serine/threonine protein kinase
MGVVLFEMLTGRPPFVGDSHVAIAVAQQSQVAPDVRSLRPDVPVQLAATVARALARSPLDRYPTAVEMAVDLEQSWSPPSPPAPDPIAPTQVMAPLAMTAAMSPGDTEIMSATGTEQATAPVEAHNKPGAPRRVVAVTVAFVLLVVGVAVVALSGNDGTDPQTAATSSVAPTSVPASTTTPTTAPTTAPPTTQVATSPLVLEIIPGFPATDSLTVFVRQLDEEPALVGTAGVLLVGQLNQILDEKSVRKQRDKAKQLSTQLEIWVDDGELDPAIADALDALLAPLASKAK